jgi:hypothetical protein
MNATRLLTVAVAAIAATGLRAQFAEGFDSQATANVTEVAQPDTTVTYVDYSNMTVGATTWSLPEAPRRIPGSAATRGVLIQCNTDSTPAATAVNLIAGSTPILFSGRYRLSFDAWINVPIPIPSGGTEQLLWGVGVDNITPIEARNNRGAGTAGIYGWICGENGYGTEDACINDGDFELADLGDLQPGESVPFNEAFDSGIPGTANNCAGNRWVRVDIDTDATGTRVYFNGYEFFNEPNGIAQPGYAMIGYEDPFSSISASPDGQWGLLDNFRVTTPTGCGTTGTAIAQGTATAGEILNGSAPPAISAPLTMRLRGGPTSSVVFMTSGQPSPVTLPVPIDATCTINVELVTLDAFVAVPTNADGGGIFTIEVPNNTALCGYQQGWQWLWLDFANPSCPFQLTDGMVTTFGS